LKFEDNAAANSLTISYEAGDFQLSIGANVVANLDRGKFGATPSLRLSDDQAMTATFTAYLRDFSDATYATLEEIILQSGDVGSNWVSTLGSDAEVFTLDLTWTVEGTDHGDASDHVLTIPFCHVTGSLSEGDPNQVSISITSYATLPSTIT
tara:strand:- start:1077 stop:1532 length:456 start_codon:yes stop_codon:yes gene_type:complete